MELRSARRGERDEVLDLLARWYDDREFFALYNQNDPKFRDELCLIARDQGVLVATVQIFDRAINLDGHRTPMGGIGSVFTREDYRHKRVASDLMRLAIETMGREGFEVSLLFAERLTFYNQFGWREVERKFSVLANAASIRTPRTFTIDVFDTDRDFAEVVAIHRAYTGRFNVAAVREDTDWRANLLFAGNQPQRPGEGSAEYFVLARDGATIAAYARVTRFHGVAMLMEYGYRDSSEDAMLALLRHLGEAAAGAPHSAPLAGDHRRASLLREGAAASGVIVTHTAHDPNLEAKLAASSVPVAYHTDNNYMWRIISAEKLGQRLGLPPEGAGARAFELFASDRSLFWTSDRF
jgi:predicted N-acetyltransferase YhbS